MSDSDDVAAKPESRQDDQANEATLDKTSRTFDALEYIRTEFVKSVFAELENTIVPEAEAEEEAADTAIKQLVQDHLPTFIESKDSMDAVYEQDIALFTGEAFDTTEESFENTVMAVVEVTKGLFSLHEGVRSIKLNQDTLAKLVSFLSVPGDIYRFCGCRVLATAPSDESDEGTPRSDDSTDDDDDDSNTTSSSSSQSSPDEEEMHEAASQIPRFVRRQLLPHEEIVVWLGIFLARPKNSATRTQSGQRKTKGGRDQNTSLSRSVDFDSAAQSLRLALVFLEDHYDLVEATCLDTDLARTVSVNDATLAETTMQKESELDVLEGDGDNETKTIGNRKRASAVHATDFVYRFARALLGSALFLSDAIFYELRRTPCADSVRTETYLALLMECSVASVKLRHFCIVMRDELLSKSAAGSALNKLQQALDHVDSDDGKSDDGTASETGTVKSAVASVASKLPSEGSSSPQHTVQEDAPPTRRWHPVEAYLGALRDLHNRDVTQLCVEWARHGADAMWKSESRRVRSAFVSSSPSAAPSAGASPFAATVSHYDVGNLADSFVVAKGGAVSQQNKRGVSDATDSPIVRENSLAFSSTIRVTGGTEPQSDVGTVDVEDSITRSFLREHCTSALLPLCCLKKDSADSLDEEDEIRAIEQADERTVLFGNVNLRAAVSGSVDKLLDHATHLALSIEQRSDGIQQIMSSSGGISSPLYSLLRGIFTETEHTVSSYWRGIGTIIHSGVYETNLASETALSGAIEGRALERSLLSSNKGLISAGDGDVLSEVPDIRFVPVVTAPTESDEKEKQSLVGISTQTVRRIVETMSELSCRLICAFGRQAAANGFMMSIAGPSAGLRNAVDTRRLEIKASVAYEVLVAHIESFLCIIGDTIVQIKTSIGETAHAQTVANDAQVESIVDILTRLEDARTDMVRACLYSLDLLTKTFVLSTCAVVCAAPGSAGSLHARLDPRSVSTSLPVKVFNVALVLADRLTVLFQRYSEVFEGQETMFSSPAETTRAGTASVAAKPRRGARGRGKQQADATAKDHSAPGAPDPIASMVSTYNTQLVMKHIASHEELITLLLSNVLLTLIDGCHLRCHCAGAMESSTSLPLTRIGDSEPSDPSLDVECLADIYCTSSTLPSLISEHICMPTLFALGTRLTTATASRPVSSTPTPSELQKNKAKKELFIKFLASQQVDEIAFVAGEGVLDRFATHWMKEITYSVRNVGFIEPHLDWNNPITATPVEVASGKGANSMVRVRHYLVDTLLHIAGAHEALSRLCVPSIACATVMRLAAHAASVFVSAWNGSGGMELSMDSSPEFFVWGLLLLEAEALFLIAALKRLSDSSAVFLSKSGKLSNEVETARVQEAKTVLQQSLVSLEACSKQVGEIGSGAAERIAKSRKGTSLASMSGAERRTVRDGVVKQALESSRLLLDALCSHMEQAALEPKGAAAGGVKSSSSSSTSTMAARLAHRQQGGADSSSAAAGNTSPSKADGAAGSRFARRLQSDDNSAPSASQAKKQSTVLFQEPSVSDEEVLHEAKQHKRMSISGTTSSAIPPTGKKERHAVAANQPAAAPRGRFQRKGVI